MNIFQQAVYEIVTTINRSRLDQALIIFYAHDGSPRNGYSYHGMACKAVFLEGSERKAENVPLGLEILPNGVALILTLCHNDDRTFHK